VNLGFEIEIPEGRRRDRWKYRTPTFSEENGSSGIGRNAEYLKFTINAEEHEGRFAQINSIGLTPSVASSSEVGTEFALPKKNAPVLTCLEKATPSSELASSFPYQCKVRGEAFSHATPIHQCSSSRPKTMICILRLYYEIETRAKFVMLAYGYAMSTANNANSVNIRSNDLRDTLLESQKHAEVNRTSDNYRQLTITWLT